MLSGSGIYTYHITIKDQKYKYTYFQNLGTLSIPDELLEYFINNYKKFKASDYITLNQLIQMKQFRDNTKHFNELQTLVKQIKEVQ